MDEKIYLELKERISYLEAENDKLTRMVSELEVELRKHDPYFVRAVGPAEGSVYCRGCGNPIAEGMGECVECNR